MENVLSTLLVVVLVLLLLAGLGWGIWRRVKAYRALYHETKTYLAKRKTDN
jgi:hypothetical protein